MRHSGVESADRAWRAARRVAWVVVVVSVVAIVALAVRRGPLVGIAGALVIPYVVLAVMFLVEHALQHDRPGAEEPSVRGSVAVGH